MLLFNGDQKFESFYIKHFNNFVDLQNCTECFKNLAIYSQSIYYQSLQNNTGSFKRILTENDSWLDDNFLKKYGNSFGENVYFGSNDNYGIGFQTNNIPRIFITKDGLTGFGTNIPTTTVDIQGTLNVSSTTTLPISTSIGDVSSLEITYLDGVTGSIQSQLNSKLSSTSASLLYLPLSGGTLTGALIFQYGIRTGGTGNSDGNTFFGRNSFISRTTATNNTGFGASTLSSLTSGVGNVVIGNNTGASITTGSNNILIGNSIGSSITTGSNHINIGNRILYSPFGIFQLNSYTSSGFLTNDSSGNFITDAITIPSLRSFTGSVNTWTGSVNTSLNDLSSYTSSLNTVTGSFFKQGGNSFGTSGSIGTLDNNNLHIITSGSTRLFISSSGAIGLGTTTPINSYLITANGNTLISNGRFGTDSLGINVFNYSGVTPRISSDGNLDYLATNTHRWYRSGDLHMMSLGSTGLRISSTFSTASYSLDVQGTIGLSGILYVGNTSYGLPLSSGSDGQFLKRSNYLGSFVLNTWANILTSDVTGLNSFTGSINTSLTGLNSFSSSVNSWTGSTNTILNNFSSYTSSLNTVTGSFFKQGGNSFGANAVIGTDDNYSLSFETNGSVKAVIGTDGSIGIGTYTPLSKIHINNTGSNNTFLLTGHDSGGTYFGHNSSNIGVIAGYLNTDIIIGYNQSTTFVETTRFRSNGNVLIGTTTDSGYKIDVNGTGNFTYLRSTTGIEGTNTNPLVFSFNGNQDIWSKGTSGKIRFIDNAYANVNFSVNQNGDGYFRGNLGVGSTPPGTRTLYVQTTTNDVNFESTTNRTTGSNYAVSGNAIGVGATLNQGGFFTASGATSNYGVRIYNVLSGTNNYALYSDSTAKSYFQGNVGIGTSNPTVPFQIQKGNAGDEIARFLNALGFGLRVIAQTGGSGVNSALSSASGESISINPNNTEALRIALNGNVGIGTTNPEQKLHVDGLIKIKAYTTTEINALTGMTVGTIAMNSTISLPVFYNGTVWKRFDGSNM